MTAPTRSGLHRRTVLGLFAGTGLALLVGCSDDGSSAEALVCDAVGSGAAPGATADVPAGLVAIGTRYRELFPDDDPSAVGDGLPDDDPAAGLAALSDRVRADFESGDVVDVDGWVLARTEARAAAVLAGC